MSLTLLWGAPPTDSAVWASPGRAPKPNPRREPSARGYDSPDARRPRESRDTWRSQRGRRGGRPPGPATRLVDLTGERNPDDSGSRPLTLLWKLTQSLTHRPSHRPMPPQMAASRARAQSFREPRRATSSGRRVAPEQTSTGSLFPFSPPIAPRREVATPCPAGDCPQSWAACDPSRRP